MIKRRIKKREEKKTKKRYNILNIFADIFIRYLLVLLAGLKDLFVFYLIFTPLTVYPVYFLLSLLYPSTVSGTEILVGDYSIKFIEACVAGSAYYLLFILNLTTKMELRKRILSLLYSFFAFLILNIARIFLLSTLFINSNCNFFVFDIIHKFFWYFLSTIFVVAIWFSEVRIFNIKTIPFYSDLMFFVESIRNQKR